MTKEITDKRYVCEYCGRRYENRSDAEWCEDFHKKEMKIDEIEQAAEFTIKDYHLKLLKRMYVSWEDCEYGAPCINCKRPYGNSDAENDIAEIINYDVQENWDDEEEMWNDKAQEELYYIHRQMQIVLQIVLTTGKFETGHYIKKDKYDDLSWRKNE